MSKYFLTVDRCNEGRRGVFCNEDGVAFWKENEPHTADEIFEIIGLFSLVLSPESLLISEEELKEYTQYYPLAEFNNFYGRAVKKSDNES